MTPPKEKAKELLSQMDVKHEMKFIKGTLPISMYNSQIKQCALNCVDNIVKELERFGSDCDELQNMDGLFRYWNKVRAEISKESQT